MINYVIRRILFLVPTLFFVTIIVFLLVRWIPGSAIDVIESQLASAGAINIDRAAIAHMLGLDVPIHVQYYNWISSIFTRFDFGNSILQGRPVLDMIMERLPTTLEMGFLSLLVSILVAIPLGVFSAARQDRPSDLILRSVAVLMIAAPSFWIATLVMIYPAVWWGWSPPMELVSITKDPLKHIEIFLIPAIINGTMLAGMNMRLVRTMMLEVMRQDYIRTAWSKGLGEWTVLIKHALKNASIPVITVIGTSVAMLFGGVVIMEQIFNIPGVGLLSLQALSQRDYPVVCGITLLLGGIVMVVNLIVDISYSWLDPRVRYK